MKNEIIEEMLLKVSTPESIYESYEENFDNLLSDQRLISDIQISNTAFKDAIDDASKDLEFLRQRRLPGGISFGKIAGVIVFRLGRARIIHLPKNLLDNTAGLNLNYFLAVTTGLKDVLAVNNDDIPNTIMRELLYCIARRHVNQETLGLNFDLIACFFTKNESIKKLYE